MRARKGPIVNQLEIGLNSGKFIPLELEKPLAD
jgi:hypothetical protein